MKRLFLLVTLSLLSYHLVTIFVPSSVYAAVTNDKPFYNSYVDGAGFPVAVEECRIGNSAYKECTDFATNVNNQLTLIEQIAGCVEGMTCTQSQAQSYKNDMNRRSALGGVTHYIAMMYTNPPADTGLFLADLGQNLGFLPKTAYAQGVGFSGLSPLLGIWKGFRNIAYVLLAIVMVIVGFMVMLRKKIDPRTVVTVQSALPRIIIALILITFSYAIVGLMIDIMYLAIAFGLNVLGAQSETGILSEGFFSLMGRVFTPLAQVNTIQLIPQGIGELLKGNIAEGIVQLGVGLATNIPPGGQAGALVILLLSLAYLFAFIRIFFMLLTSYVKIVFAVIIGPLQILTEALPGGSGFSSWLKDLVSSLIAFPITIFLIILGTKIFVNVSGSNLWIPPLLPQLPNTTGSLAVSIIWLGIILVIPSVVSSIRESLKAKPAVSFGGAFSPLTEAFQTGTGALSLFYYGSSLKQTFFPSGQKPGGGKRGGQ